MFVDIILVLIAVIPLLILVSTKSLIGTIITASILSYIFNGVIETLNDFRKNVIDRPFYTNEPTLTNLILAILIWPYRLNESRQGIFALIGGILSRMFGNLFCAVMWAIIISFFLKINFFLKILVFAGITLGIIIASFILTLLFGLVNSIFKSIFWDKNTE